MRKRKIYLCLALTSSLLLAEDDISHKNESVNLEKVEVVSIVESNEALKVISNPKNPIQPIPASDGADFLKNIPGFSIVRKGGTDGDPVFRGMSGSKVGILVDGQEIYGGCGGSMDPPTAYVFPEAYDSVVVTKGPQSVLFGSGFSAGVVEFKKKNKYYPKPDYNIYSSFKQGSFGRSDQFIDISGGDTKGYGQLIATRSHSNDYKDGNGDTVNSEYTRWNTSLALGYTPTDDTTIEISGSKGDGEAKYADRAMDASKLLRENIALKVIKYDLSKNIEQLEMQIYHNYVDHIMDNYSLRPATSYSAMNPDRKTTGGSLKFTTIIPSLSLTNMSGIDFKNDIHTGRSAMMKTSASSANDAMFSAHRLTDFDFSQVGIFNESTYDINEKERIIAGIRIDDHEVLDNRQKLGMTPILNPNYLKTDEATLKSGFIRYESKIPENGFSYYTGIGHSERFPDYWERTVFNTITQYQDFIPRPEQTNQLDIGANFVNGNLSSSVSLFYSKVNNYIQTRWYMPNGSTNVPQKVNNIDATLYGGEISTSYKIGNNYKLIGALSHVLGENDTDNKPLAQQPPLEMKLSAIYDDNKYSAGILARFISKQDRYDIGNGNIVMNGADKGETPGAAVFSVNGAYKYNKNITFSTGVDNIFNKVYTEHLNRTDASSSLAFLTQEKINEPGRNIWFELKTTF